MPFMDSFRRARSSSPAPSNTSMSSTSSRLSQQEIEEILTSPYETGYTYSQSAAYRREGSVDYRYPQLCRQYPAYSNYTASPSLEEEFRHIYRAVAYPRRSIFFRVIHNTFILLKTLIVLVFAAIAYTFLLVYRGVRYLLGWLLHYLILVPLFSPYYAAKQKYYEAKYAFNVANYVFGYAKRLFLWIRSLWPAPEVMLYEEDENDDLVLRSGHRYLHGHQHKRSVFSIFKSILVWTLYVVSLGVIDFIPSSHPIIQCQTSDLKKAPTHHYANEKREAVPTVYAVLKTIVQLLLFVGTLGIYDQFSSSDVQKTTSSSSNDEHTFDSSVIRSPEDDYRARDGRGRAGISSVYQSCIHAFSSAVAGLWKVFTTVWFLTVYALTLGHYNTSLNYQRGDDSSIASRVRSRAAKQSPSSSITTTTTITRSSVSYYTNRSAASTLAAMPKGLVYGAAYCLEVIRSALWTFLVAVGDALWWLVSSIGGLFLFLFGGIVSTVYWALSTSGNAVVWTISAITNGLETLLSLLYALITLQFVRKPAAVLASWSPKHTSTPSGILKTSKTHKFQIEENGWAWMTKESARRLITWFVWALLLLPLLALLIFLFHTTAREIQVNWF